MGKYSKAKKFNKKASRKGSKANKILKTLNIQSGQIIADIGSGGGLFTFLFSQLVGDEGRVYAIDINQDFLEFITKQAIEQGLTNVTTVLTTDQSIPLASNSVDLVFVRNVYHHLQNRVQYFTRIKELLSSQGRVAIIEYSPTGSFLCFHRRRGHNVDPEIIIEEMKTAGFQVTASFDFLPVQSFLIFSLRQ